MTHRVCRAATIRGKLFWTGVIGLAALAQTTGTQPIDWRRLGNAAILRAGGGLATGPVGRIWYEGASLRIGTASGTFWQFDGDDTWTAIPAPAVPARRAEQEQSGIQYRLAQGILRSEDGGQSWENRTGPEGRPLLPGQLLDFAVGPANADEIAAAGTDGVWRSMDGGRTWASLNANLPGLPVHHILSVPSGTEPLRVAAGGEQLDWSPGQQIGWIRSGAWTDAPVESAGAGEYLYLGTRDGQILVRRGLDQQPLFQAGGPVRRIWVDARNPALALAAAGGKLYRTFNGGAYWDDVTGALTEAGILSITADPESRAVYAGTATAIYQAAWDVSLPGPPPAWRRLGAPAAGPVLDLKLDGERNQLFAAVEGWGVYSTLAPHRRQFPAVVSAADLISRAAAPGALLSLIGPPLTAVRSGELAFPVLPGSGGETQVQLPFDLTGTRLTLRMEGESGPWTVSLPLRGVAPAIVTDRDGSALVLDADSGVLLDALHPARPGMRLQILAVGLGRVRPVWPAATPAPSDQPPAVVARISARLGRQPLEIGRATLAPGYIGFYLVEAIVPPLVDAGTAELAIAADGAESNAVRVYIEP